MKKNVGISYKAFAVILAAVLILGGTIGGTMAWLIDDTTPVSNVFTDSDIEITLNETTEDYKMIPGHTIDKDPKVSVAEGSEDCYLFVKIDESANYDTYLADYAVTDGWNGELGNGVYYRIVKTSDETREFSLLKSGKYDSLNDGEFTWEDDQVLVKPEVTKAQMNAIKDGSVEEPTLTFTAYAVQLYKTNGTEFTAEQAWAKAQGIANNAE